MPLEVGGMLQGVLDIQSDQLNAFTDDDVHVLQALAGQVAIAIDNATSYQEERSRRLLTETLYEVSRALSQTLDLQEVLDLILENLAQIVPFDRGSVMLKHNSHLEIVSARGFPEASNPLQIRISIKEDDVFQQIYRAKKPLVVPEVLQRIDWQQVEGLPQARSWLGVPLIDAQDEVIGILSLTRESPTAFSEDEGVLATGVRRAGGDCAAKCAVVLGPRGGLRAVGTSGSDEIRLYLRGLARVAHAIDRDAGFQPDAASGR